MLHGVGGCTIAEAKERLSYDEALAWFAYYRKRGTFNINTKLEGGFALLAYLVAAAAHVKKSTGGPFKIVDFMPHADKESGDVTVESVFKALGGNKDG